MINAPVDVKLESEEAVRVVTVATAGVVAPRVPLTTAVVSVSPATEVVVAPSVSEVDPSVKLLFANKLFGTVAEFAAAMLVPSTYTARSAGWVQITSLEPAEKLTRLPELLEDSTVFRLSVLPLDVYVPTPTSHSPKDKLEIA
jgi:hypothetical protein